MRWRITLVLVCMSALAVSVLPAHATTALAPSPTIIEWFDSVEDPDTGNEEFVTHNAFRDGGAYVLPHDAAHRLRVKPGLYFLATGELYFVPTGLPREFAGHVSGTDEVRFGREGAYEIDVYALNPVPELVERPLTRLLAYLFGTVAHAQTEFEYAETIHFTVTHEETVEECCSSVLFLPGLQASRLYRPIVIGDGEDRLWEPDLGDEAPALTLDGIAEPDIYTKKGDVLAEAYGVANIYKSFIDSMSALATSSQIAAFESIAYDWRLDYQDLLTKGALRDAEIYWHGSRAATSSPYIIQQLRALAADSQTGKVTIIAHSNGGLLTKALTNALGGEAQNLIDKIIFVGVPQVGTPKAIAGLLHGADQGLPAAFLPIFFGPADARAVAATLPSIYHLLPSARYLQSNPDPVITFSASTLPEWYKKYGDINTWPELKAFMTDAKRSDPAYGDLSTPEIVSTVLMNNTYAVHRTLDSWTPPAGVEFISIAGWGVETLKSIEYTKVAECLTFTDYLCKAQGGKISFRLNHTIDGDGTVVESSAHAGKGKKYWVDLFEYNDDNSDKKHHSILAVSQLTEFIDNLIREERVPLPQYISTTQPTHTGNRVRLEFEVHSPMTLGFEDGSGNYVGLLQDGTVVGEIDGVYYEQYGDVQWLSLPQSLSGTLVMHGTAGGSFTLIVSQTDGTNSQDIAVYGGIPNNTNTTAMLTISGGSLPAEMTLDDNGDGEPDREVVEDSQEPVTEQKIRDDVALARTLGWITAESYKALLLKRLEPPAPKRGIKIGNRVLNIGTGPTPPALERSAALARARTFRSEIERGRANGMLTGQGYQMLLLDVERFISQ